MKEYPSLLDTRYTAQRGAVRPEEHPDDDTYFAIVHSNTTLFSTIPVSRLLTLPAAQTPHSAEHVQRESHGRYCNQYKLRGCIGHGQYAKVYSAATPLGSLVAVKQFRKKPHNHQSQFSFKQIQTHLKRARPQSTTPGTGTSPDVDRAVMEMSLDRVHWELYVLGRVQSSAHVVQLLDCIDSPVSKKNWIVFEYAPFGEVEWKDIAPQVRAVSAAAHTQYSPLQYALKFAIDTARGLHALAHAGCVHRDIKPSNILVFPHLCFKITDFGSSIVHPDRLPPVPVGKTALFTKYQAELNKIVGTPAFLPPEICNFSGPARAMSPQNLPPPTAGLSPTTSTQNLIAILDGSKIDMWAFGVSLFCVLYGALPFEGENEFDTFDKIVNDSLHESKLPLRPSIAELATHRQNVPRNNTVLDMLETLQELCLDRLLVKNFQERLSIEELHEEIVPLLVQFYNKISAENNEPTVFTTYPLPKANRSKSSLKRTLTPRKQRNSHSPPQSPSSHTTFTNNIHDNNRPPSPSKKKDPDQAKSVKGFFFSKLTSQKKNKHTSPSRKLTFVDPGSIRTIGLNNNADIKENDNTNNEDCVSISSGSSINSDLDDRMISQTHEIVNLSDLDDDNSEYAASDSSKSSFDSNEVVRVRTEEIMQRANIEDPTTTMEPPARNSERLNRQKSQTKDQQQMHAITKMVQSRGTIDFTKYLNNPNIVPPRSASDPASVPTPSPTSSSTSNHQSHSSPPEPQKPALKSKRDKRMTFLRESMVNFETQDELTRYLNFADFSASKR